jgi:hypothetical protein
MGRFGGWNLFAPASAPDQQRPDGSLQGVNPEKKENGEHRGKEHDGENQDNLDKQGEVVAAAQQILREMGIREARHHEECNY